jgi:hypothetical protein
MHGGAPGSDGPRGARNGNYKRGLYTAEAIASQGANTPGEGVVTQHLKIVIKYRSTGLVGGRSRHLTFDIALYIRFADLVVIAA